MRALLLLCGLTVLAAVAPRLATHVAPGESFARVTGSLDAQRLAVGQATGPRPTGDPRPGKGKA